MSECAAASRLPVNEGLSAGAIRQFRLALQPYSGVAAVRERGRPRQKSYPIQTEKRGLLNHSLPLFPSASP